MKVVSHIGLGSFLLTTSFSVFASNAVDVGGPAYKTGSSEWQFEVPLISA